MQVALTRALDRIDHFEHRREGAFLAYLRTILMNQLRNEVRRSLHDPAQGIPDDVADEQPALLEQMIDRDVLEAYEAALASLPELTREAIILNLEFGMSHAELAEAIGSPSPNAARMFVSRAIARLARAMDERS